jgi:hypothetical protein
VIAFPGISAASLTLPSRCRNPCYRNATRVPCGLYSLQRRHAKNIKLFLSGIKPLALHHQPTGHVVGKTRNGHSRSTRPELHYVPRLETLHHPNLPSCQAHSSAYIGRCCPNFSPTSHRLRLQEPATAKPLSASLDLANHCRILSDTCPFVLMIYLLSQYLRLILKPGT